jgi:hypothetical protein
MSAATSVITIFGLKVPTGMPVRPCPSGRARTSVLSAGPRIAEADFASEESATGSAEREMTVSEQDKAQAVERAARLLGCSDQASWQALGSLWDEAYDRGRLDALDELQDRFCVCMK